MMVLCKNSGTEIKFDSCLFHTLVIENKALLRNITYSFLHEMPEDYFVFSKHYEPFEFCKKGIYIPSAIGFDMNHKRLIAKINAELEHLLADELYEEFFEFKRQFISLAEKLIQKSDFSLDFREDISPRDLIKLFGAEMKRRDHDFAYDFIRYIQLLVQYLGVSLIVVSDLHEFFGTDELDSIYQTLLLNEVNVLCIEGVQPNAPSQYEKVHIIDCELCEIE